TPAAPLDPLQQLPYACTALEIDHPRTDVACEEKACGRPGDAAQFGPKNSPSDAEEQPGDNGKQGARDEYQTCCDVDGNKTQWSCRITADCGGNRDRIENRPP